MAQTLKGKGIVWGTHGLTAGLAASATDRIGDDTAGATTAYVTDCDASIETDTVPIETDVGETIGMVFYNQRLIYNITCVPVGSSVANATTAAGQLELVPGTKVTIADPDGTVFDATHSAAYIVTSMRKRKTNKGAAVYELTLTQYTANDLSATVT